MCVQQNVCVMCRVVLCVYYVGIGSETLVLSPSLQLCKLFFQKGKGIKEHIIYVHNNICLYVLMYV